MIEKINDLPDIENINTNAGKFTLVDGDYIIEDFNKQFIDFLSYNLNVELNNEELTINN